MNLPSLATLESRLQLALHSLKSTRNRDLLYATALGKPPRNSEKTAFDHMPPAAV